jgi:hypothetical protein
VVANPATRVVGPIPCGAARDIGEIPPAFVESAEVKRVARTPAEHTVLLLRQAAHSSSPVMIPGTWDVRAVRPAAPAIGDGEPRVTLPARMTAVSDRQRLEREREGGGAPSARGRRANVLARLWRTTLHRGGDASTSTRR